MSDRSQFIIQALKDCLRLFATDELRAFLLRLDEGSEIVRSLPGPDASQERTVHEAAQILLNRGQLEALIHELQICRPHQTEIIAHLSDALGQGMSLGMSARSTPRSQPIELLDRLVAAIDQACWSVDVWLHTVGHGLAGPHEAALHQSLIRAQARTVPVRVICAPSRDLAGACELIGNNVRVRLAANLMRTDLRYFIIDGKSVYLCVAEGRPLSGYGDTNANIEFIRSSQLAEALSREFIEVWTRPETLSPQEFMAKVGGDGRAESAKWRFPLTVVLYGPACSGKSTLMMQLVCRLPMHHLDLMDIVIPLMGRLGVYNINVSSSGQIYDALLDHLRSYSYDMLEIAPDCPPMQIVELFALLRRAGRQVACVALDADVETLRLRNSARARPIRGELLDAQLEMARNHSIEQLAAMCNVPLMKLDTRKLKVTTAVDAIEKWIWTELLV